MSVPPAYRPLILASRSPRRRQLLADAGYRFQVIPPDDAAECGICSRETPPELAARLAWQKAACVARGLDHGLILGCDTLVECRGQILGKPTGEQHARWMLRLLRGTDHHVYSGLCLWLRPGDEHQVCVDVTRLRMEPIPDGQIEEYLASGQWQDKAGAFGYQDRLGWLHILEGSASNVVGLPLELLSQMLAAMPAPPGH